MQRVVSREKHVEWPDWGTSGHERALQWWWACVSTATNNCFLNWVQTLQTTDWQTEMCLCLQDADCVSSCSGLGWVQCCGLGAINNLHIMHFKTLSNIATRILMLVLMHWCLLILNLLQSIESLPVKTVTFIDAEVFGIVAPLWYAVWSDLHRGTF